MNIKIFLPLRSFSGYLVSGAALLEVFSPTLSVSRLP